MAENLRADLGRFGKDDVGQFGLGVIRNAHRADVSVDANPFVRFGKLQIVGNIHDLGL